MRRRNSYYSIIVFSLIACLSIGFAVVNSISLSITGTAAASDRTLNVSFTGNAQVSDSTKGTINVEANSTTATFKAIDMVLNETITFSYELANYENDIMANVSATVQNNNEYFDIKIQENTTIGNTLSFNLGPMRYTTLNVIVKLIKTPTSTSNNSATFNISLTATPTVNTDATIGPLKPQPIKFKIGSNEYEADVGMTWTEWTNSSYNTIGFPKTGSYIVMGSSTNVLKYNGIMVSTSEKIIENGYYYFEDYNCCFDPNMRVLMADGTYKKIIDVEVGDMVMSLNEDTGEYIAQKVTKKIIKEHSDDLVYVNLSNGVKIGMRAYHPLLTTEGWKSLRPELVETQTDVGKVPMLEIGDTVVGYKENVTIVSIEQREHIENYNTYNLSVEGYHNYIVEGIVVHNAYSCQT